MQEKGLINFLLSIAQLQVFGGEGMEEEKKHKLWCNFMFMGKIFRGQDIYEINGFQASASISRFSQMVAYWNVFPNSKEPKWGFCSCK